MDVESLSIRSIEESTGLRSRSAIFSSNIADRGGLGPASLLIPFSLYLAGFFTFFRWQIFSKFDLIFGNRGDARMVSFLHEHVYRWLQGGAALLSPPFFFDQTKTLGYTDAFLLDQVIFAPLRVIGAEPLLALSLTAVILSALAYAFVYLFLRGLALSVAVASFGAFIFTFPNNLYLKSMHLQHFAVYYIPLVVYCGLLAVTELHRRPVRACLLGALAAGLYGLLFSTGYYMAWFFGLALLIFAPIATFIAWPEVRAWWSVRPRRILALGLAAGLSFFAALSIFVTIYGPILATGAARGFAEYLAFTPRPIDIVNVGTSNMIWSGLIRSLRLIHDNRLNNGEVSVALTPVLQVLLAVSFVLALRPQFWPATASGRISRAFVIAGASVCLALYLLTISVGTASLFHILYVIVPGANAIRVGYRGMVVTNLFAATAVGLTFDRIIRLSLQKPLTFLDCGRLAALTALLCVAAIEQVNLDRRTYLSRTYERDHMATLGGAPPECRSFYAAPQAGRAPYEVQIDAMMVAQDQRLPTINGYSGLFPPGWDFYETNAADYAQRAMRWAVNRGIADGLCRVDVEKGTWTMVALDRH